MLASLGEKGLRNTKHFPCFLCLSLRNKMDEINVLMQLCRFDILAITETHLDKKISNQQLEIENYKIVRRDRNIGTVGGGCLVYIGNHICSTRLKSIETPEIEGIWLKISVNSSAFIVDTIYRSPSDSAFFNHFELVLEKVWAKFKNVVIMGDLNCDFARKERNIVTSTFGRKLQILITQFNYTVANDQPTRIASNTSTLIDLVITSRPDLITKTKILELGISDHMLVQATLKTKIKRPPPKIVRARSYRRFNKSMFAKEIEEAPCSTFENPEILPDLPDICNEGENEGEYVIYVMKGKMKKFICMQTIRQSM